MSFHLEDIQWFHTLLVFIFCIALMIIIYETTGVLFFVLLFIPPAFIIGKKKRSK